MVETTKEMLSAQERIEGQLMEVVEPVEKGIKIRTEEDAQLAAASLTGIKRISKFLKEEKEKITKPINEALKAARNMFAPFEDRVEKAEAIVKAALGAYADKIEAANLKRENDLAAKAAAGTMKPETAARKMEEMKDSGAARKTGEGTVSFSKIKQVRVIKREAVPEEFWVLDMVAVRKAALATGKLGEVIPGVEVYEERNVGARV